MTIEVVTAVLAERVDFMDGQVVVTGPMDYWRIAVSERDRFQAAGLKGIKLNTNDLVVWLTLIGGHANQEISVTYQVVYPDPQWNADSPLHTNSYQWPAESVVFSIQMPFVSSTGIAFAENGICRIKFLLDGEPLTELLWPIYWDDEKAAPSSKVP